jgi:5-deoxy-glucuronate isomerase
VEANHLIVGETFNRSGQWSSYPPHKHEQDVPGIESRQEELYFFRLNPEQGFGFMRVYTDDRSIDQPMVLEQNDLVVIPKGYHPVCAAPGYNLYYLWMLAGPTRTLTMRDDPEHAWVK